MLMISLKLCPGEPEGGVGTLSCVLSSQVLGTGGSQRMGSTTWDNEDGVKPSFGDWVRSRVGSAPYIRCCMWMPEGDVFWKLQSFLFGVL